MEPVFYLDISWRGTFPNVSGFLQSVPSQYNYVLLALHQQTSAYEVQFTTLRVQQEALCTGLRTTKIVFGCGSAPDPTGGAQDAPQIPWSAGEGDTSLLFLLLTGHFHTSKFQPINFPQCHHLDAEECICLFHHLLCNDYEIFHRQSAFLHQRTSADGMLIYSK